MLWRYNYQFKETDIAKTIYRYDYLIISNEDGQIFGVYCGDRTGKKVLVTGDLVVIKFHSDSSAPRRGFLMTFTAVSPGSIRTGTYSWACYFNPINTGGTNISDAEISNDNVFFTCVQVSIRFMTLSEIHLNLETIRY